jgi:hypothetical protein
MAGQEAQNKGTGFLSKIFWSDLATLSKADRERLERRADRLVRLRPQVNAAGVALSRIPTGKQLLVRWQFASRAQPVEVGDWSDRALPPRRLRPPSTRLISPRGLALRFYLIALFAAQSRTSGERPGNTLQLNDRDADVSWVNLVATAAERGKGQDQSISVRDQNVRQIQQALRRLADPEVQLVALPNKDKAVGTYEKFLLLRENGAGESEDAEPNERYTVPGNNTAHLLRLPSGLLLNGWIHVLEDGELALLLMIAALHALYGWDRQVYLDGETRLLQFGIGRDTYLAHHQLQRFGLIDVEADPRRFGLGSSRVEGHTDGSPPPQPHRFRLLRSGFAAPAADTVLEAVNARLGRRTVAGQ